MRPTHILYLLLALFLTVASAHAAQPNEMLSDPKLEARAKFLGEELRCLVCQNESIEDSNAPLAHDLRVLLRQRLTAGDTDETAKQYIVARYGDYVLLKPPFKASTLLLWLGPLFLLLVTLACAIVFYRQKKGAPEDNTGRPRRIDQTRPDRHDMQRIVLIITPIVLLAAGSLYIYLGAPELPDRPFAERQNDPDFKLNAAAEIIAAELETRPDAEGYKHLAGMFYALHRYDESVDAAHRATELNAKDGEAWGQLGESLVMENDGTVTMDALNTFKRALKIDSQNPRARFYVGLAETEIGNLKKAVGIWRDLEQSAPPGAPWLPMVKQNIALYAKQGGFDPDSVKPMSPNLK